MNFHNREEEAAKWIIAHDRRVMSQEDQAAFKVWQRDPANAFAIETVRRSWAELNDLRSVIPLMEADAASSAVLRRRSFLIGATKAAAVLATVSLGAGFLYRSSEGGDSKVVETLVGERRSIPLADGSVAHLNVASRLRYRMDSSIRNINLEFGQAEFVVASDADRPFIVRARQRRLRTFGGVFDVNVNSGVTAVAVREGDVALLNGEVTPTPKGQGNSALVLRPGDMVSYSGPDVTPVRSVQIASIGEWRDGILNFYNVPLSDVVGELNRQFPGRLSVQDAELGQQIVTLRLQLSDRDGTLKKVARLLSLDLVKRGQEAILVRS